MHIPLIHTLFRLILVLHLAPQAWSIWPFAPKKFNGNKMLDAGSMGIDNGERAIAFGDFNGDQFLDILMLDADAQTMSIYLWNHELFSFTKSASFRHTSKVYNVVPGDFTHSGKLDLLVMGASTTGGPLNLIVYPALPEGGFDVMNPLSAPVSSLSQPIPIDLDGDMKIDLLGSSSSGGNTFRAWQNVWNGSNSSLFNIIDPPFYGSQCSIANPHSNAVVDLDGDCLADVFLLCDDGRGGRFFQIWINEKDNGFSLSQQASLPQGVQSVSFADMNRDGTIDMIFPTCTSVSSSTGVGSNCVINIAYNQQLRLCSSTETSFKGGVRVCRSPEELCTADPNFKFDTSTDALVRIPLADVYSSSSLLVLDTSFSPPIPLPFKLGDVNLDGFPDLLFILATSAQARTPKLLVNSPCGNNVIGCKNGESRGWQVVKKDVEILDGITDARSVSFLDMDEDGTLDILVQRSGDNGSGKILFVQNNFYYDAFFLKAIVLNGACDNGWCYTDNGTRYHPFGVSYSGASYKYTVLDTTGKRAAAQVGQLPQTSYHSLQTPYSFFGLGRTNNYIENLFVGSTMHTEQHFINMEGVVPNSKVVISPTTRDGAAWKRELFLRPGEWIPWVTLTVAIGMVVLAVIVLILHLNEKREDELERRRVSHHINFDAL